MAEPSSSMEAVTVTGTTTSTTCPAISTSIAPRRARRLFVDKADPPTEVSLENEANVKCDSNQPSVDPVNEDDVGDDDRRKIRRGWNVWTPLETRTFFAALSYHGKDFLAIQSYMQNKGLGDSSKKTKPVLVSGNNCDNDRKRASASTPPQLKDSSTGFKTREQVRHYYYRTWHKISNALSDIVTTNPASSSSANEDVDSDTNNAVDKSVLELYGLINYGEIWKKIGSRFDAKIKCHLKELVLEGVTVIRGLKNNSKSGGSKGIKIKTPNCRALKKINGFTVENESPGSDMLPSMSSLPNHSLPEELMIELVPFNNESFIRVQELAQNPRVKTKVRLDKRVSSLVQYLETKKWNDTYTRSSRLNFYGGNDGITNLSNRPLKRCVVLKLEDTLIAQLDTDIKLAKKDNDKNNSSTMTANFAPPSQVLHFKYYLANMKSDSKVTEKNELNSAKKKSKSSLEDGKDTSKKVVSDVVEVNEESCSSASSFAPFKETVKKLNQLNQVLAGVQESVGDEAENAPIDSSCNDHPEEKMIPVRDEVSLPPEDVKLSQWLRLKEQHLEPSVEDVRNMQLHPQDHSIDNTLDTKSVTQEFLVEAETIKKGFMSKSGSFVTFGELYCLLKYPSKVTFTYEFIREPRSTFDCIAIEEALVSLAEKKKKSALVDRLINSLAICSNLQKRSQTTNATSNSNVMNNHQSKPIVGQNNSVPSPPKMISNHNFLIPTGPAPRSAIVSNAIDCPQPVMGFTPTPILSQLVSESNTDKRNFSTKRQRVVCEDPQLVQDAIKQLNTNRLPRKRPRSIRPTPIGPVAGKPDQSFVPNQNASPTVVVQQPITPLIDGKQLIISNGSSVYQVVQTPSAPIQIIGQNPNSGFQQQSPASSHLPICISPSTFTVGGLQPTLVLTSNIQPAMSIPNQNITVNGSYSSTGISVQNSASLNASGSISPNHSVEPQNSERTMSSVEEVIPSSVISSSNSSQDNFLSSLNDLSLPEMTQSSPAPNVTNASSAGVGVTITTINNPFIGSENSNSSISEFITFASNGDNVRPGELNASNGRPSPLPSTTPAWLHDHLTNSNSLGLSNLFELK